MRSTWQRAAVRDILERTEEFRSAQQIHAALEAEGTKVGLATVYRNLTALAEAGEVDQVRSDEEVDTIAAELVDRYGPMPEPVQALLGVARFRRCGHTVEVAGGELEEWIARVSAQAGFTQMEHTAEFFGVCASCSKD